ncbi:MAG: alkaline phosphatase D family protein, partial [Planctomycetes bacterium]|nr:alkaline phosphatase D family protein [Planctomycetota bacterium]
MRIALIVIATLLTLAPSARAAETKITHGPILGRLSHDGVGVWARTARPGAFRVRYGTTPLKLDRVSPAVNTSLAHDNTGWIHVKGLAADTAYYYRLETAEGTPGAGGSFRTLPDGAALRDPKLNPKGLFNLRFEYACGNNQDPKHGAGPNGPAFKTMYEQLAGNINFSIQNGDWLYEDKRMYSPAQWLTQVGATPDQIPHVMRIAPTIAGVWENYKVYLERGANLAKYHRHVPTFFTFDDHEILNDVWGAGSPGLRDRRAVFRDIGVRAWYDYLGWSNPVKFKQRAVFGRAALRAGGDVL